VRLSTAIILNGRMCVDLNIFPVKLPFEMLTNECFQVYNNVSIRWTTHHPKGLTNLDVTMARLCDSFV
jgi:hypothetical protein